MKLNSKIAKVALGVMLLGSSVFAQSLEDAKKAIDAEQYQKAKGMLKNLTVTQATKDENFFYLGWVYLLQDYPDSAKAMFTKGLSVDPKSALNLVGLGVLDHLSKDDAGANTEFAKAMGFTGKHDSKPYLYMGKGYLILIPPAKAVSPADAAAATAALTKGSVANPKDAEIFVELGNAGRSQRNTTVAYENYNNALAIDPKSLAANVAEGVLWSNAQNFEDAEKQYKVAVGIDPNFGPAYREWAETDLYWAKTVKSMASAKVKEAVDHYQKFLSLTDQSTESLLRYALFLYNAGDYVTLESVASTLAKSANSNALVYRYIGYSGYENKDYPAGMKAMDTWFTKADPSRIIPSDYLILGHLQIASGKDTAQGVANLKKAADLDTTLKEDIYLEIARMYRLKGKYPQAVVAYQELIAKVPYRPLLQEHLYLGIDAYTAFKGQVVDAKTNPAIKPDSSLLAVGDSALSYFQQKVAQKITPAIYYVPLYRAYIADEKDPSLQTLKGLAKPFYEEVIAIITAGTPTDSQKRTLAEAYAYLGNYYEYHDKDDAKALENFTKARDLNPDNRYAKFYFDQKAVPAKK